MSVPPEIRQRAEALIASERTLFAERHPLSKQMAARAGEHFPGGVPLHWMLDWETPFPLFVREAKGSIVTDVDGLSYSDFCLGDTGAMFGHSPAPVARAIAEQASTGLTAMLPSELTAHVGELLAAHFGFPFWQVTATASDANRAVVRWARALTGRRKVLVFDGCYHGQLEDAFVKLDDGETKMKSSLLGQIVDIAETSIAAPFNDLEAAEAILAHEDVALVLTEPALTNTAMVLPKDGFIEKLIAAARRHGTLVCIDETHTISTGPGGFTRAHSLDPDFFVLGKPVAGGLSAAVFGFTAKVEADMAHVLETKSPGYSGIGTTLSGNMLALAAMRACLEEVMTPENYAHMISLAEKLASGLRTEVTRHSLPWTVTQIGARAELVFSSRPLESGAEAAAAIDHAVERAIHLFLLNRNVLVTPFHNMTLVAPTTTEADVKRLVSRFGEALSALCGENGTTR
ncbi:aspartate aminotransferase family protein [Parvibaculum sp.]|uniref:aspartate aminotransferase family protein n=1 Tax=Parvibaculum sp. TaxID=2024848 RepID=UPI001B11BA3D|nr:aspartate aminotransferase family protein [Parvibaculum sp.]MBO6633998.1 aspartate aminotransferase family protein [Parvibaculum sp.]MBO6680054.1 aspartate aminotransferase family protein [Parvibaculum sp.]MBO6683617.1 aspartate aminotransferase family protein [Parvibaculum sp.]